MLRQWRQRAEDVRHNGFYWCVLLLQRGVMRSSDMLFGAAGNTF
jgi:hypothetical protein